MTRNYHTPFGVSNHFDLDDVKARISILDVVSRYIPLKRSGRAFVGLCPFHSDRNPSFHVSEEKRAYYCFACAEGGDVVRFIEKIENTDFKGALAILGLSGETARPLSYREIEKRQKIKDASKSLTAWASEVSQKVAAMMREVGQQTHLACEALEQIEQLPFVDAQSEEIWREKIDLCEDESAVLETLHDDLADPDFVLELWKKLDVIEKIAGDGGAYTQHEVEQMFPPWTQEYRGQLLSFVRGEV